jgi:hypothetical protein
MIIGFSAHETKKEGFYVVCVSEVTWMDNKIVVIDVGC